RAPFARAAEPPAGSSDAAARLGALEKKMAATTGAERAALARECDQVRGVLVELAPEDPRAPSWLIDRAAYTIDRLGDDGTDNAVLVGLPSGPQRRRCVAASLEALRTLEQARSIAETTTARLEESILDLRGEHGDVAGKAAEAERDLHRLVDLEQAQRIPFLN